MPKNINITDIDFLGANISKNINEIEIVINYIYKDSDGNEVGSVKQKQFTLSGTILTQIQNFITSKISNIKIEEGI